MQQQIGIGKRPKGAVWFVLRRDAGEAWEPVELEGESYFKLDGVLDPAQLAQLDADARRESGTYRVEYRPQRKNGRHLGDSLPFHVAAQIITPAPAMPAPEEPDDDEGEEDDDDDEPDEETGDTEPPPAPAPGPFPAPRKPRIPARPNGHANGNGRGLASPGGAGVAGFPQIPPMPTEYAGQAMAMMFPFQAFAYLKHAADADAERAAAERASRDQKDREFNFAMMTMLTTQQKESAKTMQAFFERVIDIERERREEAEERADDDDEPAQSDEMVKAMIEQLAQIRAKLEEHKAELVNDGEGVDFEGLANAAGGFFKMISEIPGIQERWPQLAAFFNNKKAG